MWVGSPDSIVAPTVTTGADPVAPETPRAAVRLSLVGAALAAVGIRARAAAMVPTADAETSRFGRSITDVSQRSKLTRQPSVLAPRTARVLRPPGIQLNCTFGVVRAETVFAVAARPDLPRYRDLHAETVGSL